MIKIVLLVYVCYLVLASLISFFLFGKDKKMAVKNNSAVRIKEKTLLGITSLGGAIGSFLGRIVFRHKTNKIYFSITIIFSLIMQLLVLGVIAYFSFM